MLNSVLHHREKDLQINNEILSRLQPFVTTAGDNKQHQNHQQQQQQPEEQESQHQQLGLSTIIHGDQHHIDDNTNKEDINTNLSIVHSTCNTSNLSLDEKYDSSGCFSFEAFKMALTHEQNSSAAESSSCTSPIENKDVVVIERNLQNTSPPSLLSSPYSGNGATNAAATTSSCRSSSACLNDSDDMNQNQDAMSNYSSNTTNNSIHSYYNQRNPNSNLTSIMYHQHQQPQQQLNYQHHRMFTSSIPPTSQLQQHQQLQHQHQQQQQQQQHQHQHIHQQHSTMKSPYQQQTEKRQVDNMQQSTSSTKQINSKSCWCFGGDQYHFKILVPAVAAGAIIGKGGETIASLQRDTGAKVKMSKTHDFYPGTSERVCLITGSVDAIMTVLDFVVDKIREKPDLTNKTPDDSKQNQDRDKQVKVLVANTTAGMIIGKAGAYIKQIKEESGSYVQISQKPKDIALQERCITIIGEKESNRIACKMILSKIVEDPQSGSCLNVSYADISGPVANFNPTGSPYATNQNAINSSTASLTSAIGTAVGNTGFGVNLSLNLTSPTAAPNPAIATQLLDHIKVAMRGSGYTENVTKEVCAALGVLAKHGILGVGVSLPHTNGAHSAPVSYLGVSALEQSAAAASAAAAAGNVFGALGQVNLEQYIGQPTTPKIPTIDPSSQFDPFRHPGSQAATPISVNNNTFGLAAAATGGATAQALGAMSKSPTPGDLGAKESKTIEVSDGIVGAILGPNGRTLVEIQHVSGANIQISKKGIFAPGTRNRIVTITGSQSAIATAHCLIEQKINEEETKRARQNPVTEAIQ